MSHHAPITTHRFPGVLISNISTAPAPSLSARVRTRSPVKLPYGRTTRAQHSLPSVHHHPASSASAAPSVRSSEPALSASPAITVPLVRPSQVGSKAKLPGFMDLLLHPQTHPALQAIKAVSRTRVLE